MKDYLIIERDSVGRKLSDAEWKALRDWVSVQATTAMNAILFIDLEDEWRICEHDVLFAPADDDNCYACEVGV